jgi:hypothetical protein
MDDARRPTPELGNKFFDLKVEYAVKQIRGFTGGKCIRTDRSSPPGGQGSACGDQRLPASR